MNNSKDIEELLENWLNDAASASYLGVSISDKRSEEQREKQYQYYLEQATNSIEQLILIERKEIINTILANRPKDKYWGNRKPGRYEQALDDYEDVIKAYRRES